uniref:Uncharacterized protein n=1 Tax=Arion vulgaris TaxID=1028688 RepID=A0A0B7BC03_9EUPU
MCITQAAYVSHSTSGGSRKHIPKENGSVSGNLFDRIKQEIIARFSHVKK